MQLSDATDQQNADTATPETRSDSDVSGTQQNTEKDQKTESKENTDAVQAESNATKTETATPAGASASTSEPKALSAATPSVTEKAEKISDKTEEKADENGGSTKTRTEVYQHEKTTVTKSEGVPDEAEKQANRDEKR